MRHEIRWIFGLTWLLSAACDEQPVPGQRPMFEADAGAPIPRFAVVSSDWGASAVSLLGQAGELVADDYLTSGSARSGLVTALSGDVELPTQANDPGTLVLIDRYRTDVITRIDLSSGTILGQVKTHTPPTQSTRNAYSSNPHDYLRVDDHTAWVTRNQPNLDPSVAEIDRGNDLLRIDPTSMERSDERIDLSILNGRATRKNPDTGAEEEVDVYARPSRMVRVENTLVVGLGRSAFDFSAVGSGMVALVDLETREVEGLSIDGMQGCTSVTPIPNSQHDVLVACGGVYRTERTTAGVVVVHVEQGVATIKRSWRAADHPAIPAFSTGFVAINDSLLTAAANKYSGSEPSVFGTLDLVRNTFSQLLSIPAGKGSFGTACFDATSGLLLVPDASVDRDRRPTSGIRLLQQDGEGFVESGVTVVSQRTAMPARHLVAL